MSEASEGLTLLERALDQAGSVVGAVRPEQLDDPTTCQDWKVRDLLEHMVGGVRGFAGVVAGEEMRSFEAKVDDGDYRAAYRDGANALLAAWRSEGAMQRQMRMRVAELPAPAALNLQITESALHCWDLARSTKQTPALDPAVAEAGLAFTQRMMTPERRGPSFGPEQPAPPDAGPYERLAAFTGRDIGAV